MTVGICAKSEIILKVFSGFEFRDLRRLLEFFQTDLSKPNLYGVYFVNWCNVML